MHNYYDCACAMSIIFHVKVPYKSEMKSFTVHTPQRKKCIKCITRRSHVSLVSSVINSPSTSKRIMSELVCKIKSEMKVLNSAKHDSILRYVLSLQN